MKNRSLLVWVAIGLAIVIVLVAISGGVAYLVVSRRAAAQQGEKTTPAKSKQTVLMEEWSFTTNLADLGSKRYIQVKFRIEVADEKAVKEVTDADAKLKAEVLALLAGKTVADVSGEQGLINLSNDILQRLNRNLTTAALRVYITERVIQ